MSSKEEPLEYPESEYPEEVREAVEKHSQVTETNRLLSAREITPEEALARMDEVLKSE